MGTELLRVCVKEENDDFPSAPPGFESYSSSLTPIKVEEYSEKRDSENLISSVASTSTSKTQSVHVESDVLKVTRSLRRRIKYERYNNCSDEDCDSDLPGQNFSSRSLLPKGVIRGCADCSDCQKVTARWRPEESHRPDLEDAPVFYPTEEEFEDTLGYIASIRPKAEPYGICRIVPPPSWKPPCPLKEKTTWESSKFATRVQRIDKLQNRGSVRTMSRLHSQMRKKRRRGSRMGPDSTSDNVGIGDGGASSEAEIFGFEPGPPFTLEIFEKYADDFKAQYFLKAETDTVKERCEPSIDNIEGEYWRMVEKPTEEIEVLYGADLETGSFGSGFPKVCCQDGSASDERYVKSGWNLNNFPRLPGSVLSYESSEISGVLVPWLYIGMCFSSFCWHVEDHHLYSLNYMHWGAPKIWYGVAEKDAHRLEEAMRKHLPDLFEEQPDLLHKLVTQLSPSILKSEGVPVYRCTQNPGEFVLTFPRAYHSGFNSGFNCAEAVNVAPVDWFPHGQIAIELYREQRRRTSISHDKLLLGAAREAVRAQWELNLLRKNTADNLRWRGVCGKDGILAKTFKTRVDMERARRNLPVGISQAKKMENNFDTTNERECSLCLFDLHLSAVGCRCSPDRYVCLNHAKQLCSCAWGTRFFLFRYDINELNILVEALEGKLSAVYRWARLDLGLALSSYISKERIQFSRSMLCSEEQSFKDPKTQVLFNSLKDSHLVGPLQSPTMTAGDLSSQQNNKQAEDSIVASNLKSSVCQLSQEDTSYCESSVAEKNRVDKASVLEQDVILLSDDESDEPKRQQVLDQEKESSLENSIKKSVGLPYSGCTVSTCNNDKDAVLALPVINVAVKVEKDIISSSSNKKGSKCLLPQAVPIKEDPSEDHTAVLKTSESNSTDLTVSESSCKNSSIFSTPRDGNSKQVQISSSENPSNETKLEDREVNTSSNLSDNIKPISCAQKSLDRHVRQKGPRIAKVVRRINCNVEPLEFGIVVSGHSWSNSRAIFPKGFKSRVRYISVLDPSNMCYYISDILDAGRDGPLFMVSLEHCPGEVFIHVSAARCWELVRERVNQEITRQHKLGKANLPPLQPPGSLDAFEMFGFTSPAIVQAIEAMDQNRICTEYWDSRPYSRPQVRIPQPSHQSTDSNLNFHTMARERNDTGTPEDNLLPAGVHKILGGLFKKSNREELQALYSILRYDNRSASDQGSLIRLLNEEIQERPR